MGNTNVSIQRLVALESKLARVLLEVESGLGTRYVALETIDIQCNELLQEVDDLRAEVAGGREEVDSILIGLFFFLFSALSRRARIQ
jgi:hypothetical protein